VEEREREREIERESTNEVEVFGKALKGAKREGEIQPE
jgi:hypothetical protein